MHVMPSSSMHLAQLNVGRLRAPMDDPMIDDFRMNLAPVNALAEVSPGFVWRLQDETGDATSIKPFGDELEIVNLTVWTSIDALADFTYRSGHVEIMPGGASSSRPPRSRSCACGGSPRARSPRWPRPSIDSSTCVRTARPPPPSRSATASSPATRTRTSAASATPARSEHRPGGPSVQRARGRAAPPPEPVPRDRRCSVPGAGTSHRQNRVGRSAHRCSTPSMAASRAA